jgi:16S rRNA (adenine1518-N6/adenine1519-N6)-dimethyltransferase
VKLSEIRSTLRSIGVSPVKTLGQNFLHDQNLSRWIAARAEVKPRDLIIEIGPGLGALTDVLLSLGANVVAIEKDARLAEFVRNRYANRSLEIRHADALDCDPRTFLTEPQAKLIGNLPYKVAGPLMTHWLRYPTPFSLVIFMLQKEMAERLCARPGSKSYGALTVLLQFRYHIKFLKTVPATVFLPQPEVDSAIVALQPRPAEEVPQCDSGVLVNLIRSGFGQRRKQLRKLVADYIPNWPDAAATLRIPKDVRAEMLSLQQWVELANFARPIPHPDTEKAAAEWFPVVNEEDEVLRAAPRSQVHANNLLHRAVHILIFNAKGEIFLQLRSRCKDRHPLRWDSSAAGHVDVEEDYDKAAVRELEEELGIAPPLRRVCKLPATDQTDQEFVWVYRGDHEGPFLLNRAEIEAGEFFPSSIVSGWVQARPDDFAPGFAECWKAYLCTVAAAD